MTSNGCKQRASSHRCCMSSYEGPGVTVMPCAQALQSGGEVKRRALEKRLSLEAGASHYKTPSTLISCDLRPSYQAFQGLPGSTPPCRPGSRSAVSFWLLRHTQLFPSSRSLSMLFSSPGTLIPCSLQVRFPHKYPHLRKSFLGHSTGLNSDPSPYPQICAYPNT